MKRKYVVIIVLALLVFAWSGCSFRGDNRRFEQAHSLMNVSPDSVLSLLGEINWRELSEKDMAHYSLLYYMAQDKSGQDVYSDSLIGLAYSYYKDKEQDTLYAKSQYYRGVCYLLNDSTRLAEDCFIRAIHASKQTGDNYTAYLALNRLSNSLKRSAPHDAVEYAKEACRLYTEKFNGNPSNKVYLLLEIADCYSLALQTDSARCYYGHAMSCAQELEDASLQSGVCQSLSVFMRKLEKNDSALFYSKQAWAMSPQRNTSLMSNLAHAYFMADSVQQSEELLLRLCKSKSDITRQGAYQLLAECALRKGNLEQALEYSDSTLSVYKRKYDSTLKDRAAYFQASIQNLQNLEMMKREKERQQFIYLGIGLAIFFLLLLLAIYNRNRALLFRNRALEMEKEKERAEKEKEIETLRYSSDKEMQELRLLQKENQIKLLKTYVCTMIDVHERISENLEKDRHNFLSNQSLWADLEHFLDADGGFVTRLRTDFPGLSLEDLRFCMLLRLGISIKKLSVIYGISEDSVKQKQSKFKAKRGIEKTAYSLRKYLQSY